MRDWLDAHWSAALHDFQAFADADLEPRNAQPKGSQAP
jgi:hypothetical protein